MSLRYPQAPPLPDWATPSSQHPGSGSSPVSHEEGPVRVPTWPSLRERGPQAHLRPRRAPPRLAPGQAGAWPCHVPRAPAARQPALPGPGGPERPTATCQRETDQKTEKGLPPGLLSLTFEPVFVFFHIMRIKMRLKIQRRCVQQKGQTDHYPEVHTGVASGWQARQRLPSPPCAHPSL